MWSQLRDISIRVDEDAERGTPLNVSLYYARPHLLANSNQQRGDASRELRGTRQVFNENDRVRRSFGALVSHRMATWISK
jgi:hypothetical protein